MPVGRGSVARAAKAAAEPAEKKAAPKKAAAEPAAKKTAPRKAAPKKAAPKAKQVQEPVSSVIEAIAPEVLEAYVAPKAEPRMRKGALDGIMVIKCDLPVELL